MESPQTPIMKSMKDATHHRIFLVVIIALAVVAIGWLVYTRYYNRPLTLEERQKATLQEISEKSPAVSEQHKNELLDQLTKQNTAVKISEEERIQLLQSAGKDTQP